MDEFDTGFVQLTTTAPKTNIRHVAMAESIQEGIDV